MIKTLDLKKLTELESALILPHAFPDGDTIGSCIGLALALENIGTKTRIVLDDTLPDDIAYLAEGRLTSVADFLAENFAYDTCICVDMSSLDRLEERVFLTENKTIFNIDHHISNDAFGDYQYVEIRPATGELMYDILTQLKLEITPDIAEALYLAIVTDTGGFKYRGVTSETFRVAAELVATDFDRERVMFNLYYNRSLTQVQLHSRVLGAARYYQDGRVALAVVTQDMLNELGAKYEDSDGVVESIRDIAGVEVVFLVKEKLNQGLKISIRSIGDIDASKIAVKHHGGGHQNAAGFSLDMTVAECQKYFEDEIFPYV